MPFFTPSNVSFVPTGTTTATSGLDTDEVDARIAPWARAVAPSGTAPATRLPSLQRRYAYYEAATPDRDDTIDMGIDAGDFDPRVNVRNFTLPGGINMANSVLDQWDGNNHPWNDSGNYIEANIAGFNSVIRVIPVLYSGVAEEAAIRIAVADQNNSYIATAAQIVFPNESSDVDARPRGHLNMLEFPMFRFSDYTNNQNARAFIQWIGFEQTGLKPAGLIFWSDQNYG